MRFILYFLWISLLVDLWVFHLFFSHLMQSLHFLYCICNYTLHSCQPIIDTLHLHYVIHLSHLFRRQLWQHLSIHFHLLIQQLFHHPHFLRLHPNTLSLHMQLHFFVDFPERIPENTPNQLIHFLIVPSDVAVFLDLKGHGAGTDLRRGKVVV